MPEEHPKREAMKTVNINGKDYPCRITMGAMLRFRNETGHDVSAMKSDDLADLVTFLWCCLASACSADRVEFGYSLMDFADSVDPDVIQEFFKDTGEDAGASDTKADPPTS